MLQFRCWRHLVLRATKSRDLRWIYGLFVLDVGFALPVAVGVQDERGPTLRLHLVARLLEHLRVEPADHLAPAARPQRAARVLREHQVMRGEARADVSPRRARAVVHCEGMARTQRPAELAARV